MDRLDRLGWAAGFSITSFGVRLGVRTTDPALLPALEKVLPPGWKPSARPSVPHLYSLVAGGPGDRKGTRRLWVLYDGWVRVARHRELDPVLESLESLLRATVAEESPRRVFVHAGVVGWKGKAIVIPGRSFSGKTTLVSELVRAGASYYSDEYAVIDAHGRVHPFHSPMSIRVPGSYAGTDHHAEALGGRNGSKPLRIGLVVASEFKAPGVKWRPTRPSPAEGALLMIANTVSARRAPEKALATLREALRGAVVLKGKRGEASEMVASLLTEAQKAPENGA